MPIAQALRNAPRLWKAVAWSVLLIVVGAGASAFVVYRQYRADPLITVLHVPDVYSRRAGSLSANATVQAARRVKSIEYRVNDHPWHRIKEIAANRFVNRVVTLEMPEQELNPGKNKLRIRAHAPWHPADGREVAFSYDPSPIALPLHRTWKGEQLEVQDGYWEIVDVDGQWRVRPKPGYEGYDRILLVAGALPVPRRIETYAVFRHARPTHRKEVAFGVLGLWGGHPGPWSELPRQGWSFAMAVYWSKPGGVGSEISYYEGKAPPRWVNSYRNADLVENEPYHFVIEIDDERVRGRHQFYRQRAKIWRESQPEPDEWIVLTDREGARLPETEYGIALFTLDCQAEFGPVSVLPLEKDAPRTAERAHGP